MGVSAKYMPIFIVILISSFVIPIIGKIMTERQIQMYRNRVEKMFYHAYDSYIYNAYPYDELRPLSCDGVDTWGSFSLTLIDALDTLAVLGNSSEFSRVAHLLVEKADFNTDINVSVFETNIRVVGGLLSAHLLSRRMGMVLEPGWPCSGPLLRLAETVGRKLLPAFNTKTGMPYGTVNLLYGVPTGETSVTCTAGVTTYIVEFGALSRLTGDPIFENVAMRALFSMWKAKSKIGLVGNHIDVQSGKWVAVDSGIGAGVDSYYEYLVKGSILLQRPELMEMFLEYRKAINQYMQRDDWYMWVNMQKGQVTMPLFQSLEAYWPGLLSLIGEIDSAMKSLHNYHQVWKQYGFTPEFYSIPTSEANTNREGYPLRPELIESIMYLYRATKDPILLQMGVDILESIQHSARTPCGYATIKDVRNHQIEDRMESFFLAETTKYLYLLFDTRNFIHDSGDHGTVIPTPNGECVIDTGGYIFNTEAHPIDISAIYCCSAEKKEEDGIIEEFHNKLDLLALLKFTKNDFLSHLKKKQKEKLKPKYEIWMDEISEEPITEKEESENENAETEMKEEEQQEIMVEEDQEVRQISSESSDEMLKENSLDISDEKSTTGQESCKKTKGFFETNEKCSDSSNENKYSSAINTQYTDEDLGEQNDPVRTSKLVSSMEMDHSFQEQQQVLTQQPSSSKTSTASPDDKDDIEPDSGEKIENYKIETDIKAKTEMIAAENSAVPNQNLHSGNENFREKINSNNVIHYIDQNTETSEPVSNKESKGRTPNSSVSLDEKEASNPNQNQGYDVRQLKNFSYNYEMLTCPAQPFLQRLSVLGEMFRGR